MTERKQCRLWWPEWLLSSEPSFGFLLFGWFMNAGEDLVVAAAVSLSEISPCLQQSEVQELLRYVNRRMPLPLQESSTFTLLGQCIASCSEGDLKMERQNLDDLSQRNDGQEHCNEPEQSSPSGKAVRSSLGTAFAENYRKSKCGCKKLDQGLELFRQSSTRCGTWIQLIPQTQRIMFKENRWAPKFHHMHISGQWLPICDVHLIAYKPPLFGSHHFSLNSWGFEKEVRAPFNRPNWVARLYKKSLLPDMDSVVLAINCTNAAKVHSERYLSIKGPQIHFRRICMLLSMIWHIVAALVASVSSVVYIILQVFHRSLAYGSQRFFFRFLKEILRHTFQNIHIRSCQLLYWPVFLQTYGFSSSLNMEYSHKASLKKHFIWSNVVVDLLLGNIIGLILFANAKALSFKIMLINRNVTDNLLRSGFAWLMGVPAGFKLNTELAELLGMVSLNAIQAFSTFWFIASSFLKYFINGLSLFGIVMGLTVQAALCIDMLKLATLHISMLHQLISVIYMQQIKAVASLWRLFRGRKWNPLRQRLDSYDYTVEQHVVGSLVFTPLLLLLPTTSVFYIFIAMLSTSISFICIIMEIAISILHETPYFEILLWIMRRRRFPSGLWFQIPALSSAHGSISGGLQHEGHSTFDLSMLMSFDTSGEPGYAVSIVQSNFATLGQVISPYYRNVLQGFSLLFGKSSLHGILMGQRSPFSSRIPLDAYWLRRILEALL
ncbi:phosphatidylinositol N-acetylglucosaminyltransferase subunit GPI1 isoform X2 [Dioscorea cayenensis subsp. rotundata]|uniref:Phosphatidylinositol N-acetylglucosaminyltransferase subunit GPI1 isoform X2 n=1 Tax=Dioscorea cayennensis subsp. rotundata TaxID=55577 RepID=A0AB40BUV4_DIOCR|nr:phosphatidylinositol N-acetylglucosaminyltransferase subunit GPI1 isoform X2 [Dioscorea cayenensis subsp. rotundata]